MPGSGPAIEPPDREVEEGEAEEEVVGFRGRPEEGEVRPPDRRCALEERLEGLSTTVAAAAAAMLALREDLPVWSQAGRRDVRW